MSIVSVGERRAAREASDTQGRRTYRRIFHVITNNQQDGAAQVLAASALPRMLDGYQTDTEVDTSALVIRRDPRQIHRFHWEVTIDYDTERLFEREAEGGETTGEFGEPIKVAVSFVKFQEPLAARVLPASGDPDVAPLGFGAVNAAGEPFDPPIMRDVSRPVLTFQTTSATFDIQKVRDRIDTINGDHWFGFRPHECKVEAITTPGKKAASIEASRPIQFYDVTTVIAINMNLWHARPLQQGTWFLDGALRKAFITSEGHPRIGLLAADGTALADNALEVYANIKDVYTESIFGGLGLPAQMP